LRELGEEKRSEKRGFEGEARAHLFMEEKLGLELFHGVWCELVGGRILGVGAHTSRHMLRGAHLRGGLWVEGAHIGQKGCKGSSISQGIIFKGARHLQASRQRRRGHF
jgi:hypothetical protein